MMPMNKMPVKKAAGKLTASQRKLLQKTIKRLNKESEDQVDIIYHACALALYRYHSWNNVSLQRMVITSQQVWHDCAASNEISMVQLLENETGIELMREDSDRSFHDIIYLNSSIDDGSGLDAWQWIAMRQNQIKWIPAQITACVLLMLHRQEGWKIDALRNLWIEIEDIKHEYKLNPKALREACYEETDFMITDEVTKHD